MAAELRDALATTARGDDVQREGRRWLEDDRRRRTAPVSLMMDQEALSSSPYGGGGGGTRPPHPACTVFLKITKTLKGFDDVNVLVDVEGNTGGTLRMITSEHPHIRGINFDVPHVISQAPPIPGVKHVSGDMFEAVPSGDAIFMKWILHDWSDENCVKILKNCRGALAQNGKVIVAECVLPELPEQTVKAQAVFQMDLVMMAYCLGGKERSEKELKALAMEAEFRGFEVPRRIAGGWAIMEFTK
ncbi:hypothetical protein ZIOFF_005277 [Zingiber officinale]|uniref:O-methyltransferase C-terminal domain-containing protein n=1 Tax=Zingiber officinale TaxID=94328 RepID=A0A8J5HW64_ZINOF|nr:hypothetical protein ZIOFF_005277 [Zingiber officinale]